MKRWISWIGIILVSLVLFVVVAGRLASEPRPAGQPGPAADDLARKMEAAVNRDAWDRTGAIRWSFFGQHHYLWDKSRGFVEVKWSDVRVLLRTQDRTGRAWVGQDELAGEDADDLVEKAYSFFANDSFWLNPVVKLFDDGTERALVTLEDGREALLLTYSSGGVTPGDAYLWIADPEGLPTEWKMWVKIIPIGGVGNSWEGWTELSTGAKVSTHHGGLGMNLEFISNLAGTATLTELAPGDDPFSALL